jgi:hypothetical protein
MLTDTQREYLANAIRPMQIIVTAMGSGAIMFLVVAIVVAKPAAAQPLIAYMAVAFAVAAFAAWLVVPGVIANKACQAIAAGHTPSAAVQANVSHDADVVTQLAGVFQTRLIIASALLEGAAFFNLVAYLLEGQYLSLGIASVLILLILSQFPTRGRLSVWVSHQMENIEQLLR